MSRTTPDNVTEYEPEEVQALLEQGKILLVDVREPMEYAAERIPGALLYPLSSFDAALLPPGRSAPGGVLLCGGRSLSHRSSPAHGSRPTRGTSGRRHFAVES